jgi:hypothetical protein
MDRLDMTKKAWMEPRLIVHGDVGRITQEIHKDFGPEDGFLFEGQPIGSNPS